MTETQDVMFWKEWGMIYKIWRQGKMEFQKKTRISRLESVFLIFGCFFLCPSFNQGFGGAGRQTTTSNNNINHQLHEIIFGRFLLFLFHHVAIWFVCFILVHWVHLAAGHKYEERGM